MLEPSEVDVVAYHANCPDGATAAWAAYTKRRHSVVYVPVSHTTFNAERFKAIYAGRNVLFVDFCPSADDLRTLAAGDRGVTVLVLDHHLTAAKEVAGLDIEGVVTVFDMTTSGAFMSWRYFHGDATPPGLLLAVAARDIRAPGWEEFRDWLAYADSYGWSNIVQVGALMREDREVACHYGQHIERFRRTLVKEHVQSAQVANMLGVSALAVNCSSRCLAPDVATELAARGLCDVGMSWVYEAKTKQIVFSIRSDDGHSAADLAVKHGGGGHGDAAGCAVYAERIG